MQIRGCGCQEGENAVTCHSHNVHVSLNILLETAFHVPQVELARYERQQSRQGGVLPQAEALLLAAQQADTIYSRAFHELALQVLPQLLRSSPSPERAICAVTCASKQRGWADKTCCTVRLMAASEFCWRVEAPPPPSIQTRYYLVVVEAGEDETVKASSFPAL